MRIGFVVDKLDCKGGGSNVSLDILARTLQEAGHDVTIITTNITKNNILPDSPAYDICTPQIDQRSSAHIFRSIVSTLRKLEDKFDVYHIFTPFLISMAGLYRNTKGRTPIIGRLNSYSLFCTNSTMMNGDCHSSCSIYDKYMHDDVETKTKISRIPQYLYNDQLSMRLARYIDGFFAQSPSVKKIYTESGFNEEDIQVIPNFYDDNFRKNNITPFNEREIDLLFVGQLKYGKGIDILLNAISDIKEDINVKIVGDGPHKQYLVDNYSMDNIHLTGWVDHKNLPDIYDNSKYFVHPGRWPDPCPRTVLEALQHYCIPIVSDIGGPPWMIGDVGHTFEVNNSASLSKTILQRNNKKTNNHIHKYIDNELKRFSKNNIVDKILLEYSKVVT